MKQAVAGLTVVVLAALVWLQARTFATLPEGYPGPALFPSLIAAGLCLAGALLAVTSLLEGRSGGGASGEGADATITAGGAARHGDDGEASAAERSSPITASEVSAGDATSPQTDRPASRAFGLLRVAIVVGVIGLYPVLSPAIGFVATVSLVSVVVALSLRARPAPAVATAVAGTLVIYLLFTRVLGVPL